MFFYQDHGEQNIVFNILKSKVLLVRIHISFKLKVKGNLLFIVSLQRFIPNEMIYVFELPP